MDSGLCEKIPAGVLFRATARSARGCAVASFTEAMIADKRCVILDTKKVTRLLLARKGERCFQRFGPVYTLGSVERD